MRDDRRRSDRGPGERDDRRSRGRDDRGSRGRDERRPPGQDDRGSRGRDNRRDGRAPRERGDRDHDRPARPRDDRRSGTLRRLAKLEELELEIEKIVFGGDGLGRFESIPIFVPRTAPGDRVRVRLTERKASFARAEVLELLEPGAGRREPPCPVYARCGGCDLQHLDDATQLRVKIEAAREALRRLGKVELPGDVAVVRGDSFGYRLRTQLQVATTDRGREVGYFARGSHELVPVEGCPILVPELDQQLGELPARLADDEHRRVDLTAGDGGKITVSPPIGELPTGEVTTRVGDLQYAYDARCFFQAHRQLLPRLVEEALGDASDPEGEAFDLFAGVGLFALPLARRYRRVVAVESDRIAMRYARKNARTNGIDNVELEGVSVEAFVPTMPRGAARVLVDPPRGGLSERTRRSLRLARPRRLTYVSCQAPTLARDLADLGRVFRIDRVVFLDLFPQTGHLETVVHLSLRDEEPPRE
ncbi:MAG: class I SAM-dependent RNA methyltransferase [Acidobacteriota bacterium]